MTAGNEASITSTDRPVLNEPQLRHFEVFLSMLETALGEIRSLANRPGNASSTGLIVYEADLPVDFNAKAEQRLIAIREEMTSLARKLGIEPQHRSMLRRTKALLTAELVRLDDSYSRKLAGYGKVSPRVAVEIDPVLDRVRSELVALLRACEVSPQNSNSESGQ